MVTLRSSSSRSTVSLSFVVVSLAGLPVAAVAEDAPPEAMKLPGWIESLPGGDAVAAGERDVKRPIRTLADRGDARTRHPEAAILPTSGEQATAPLGGFRRWISDRVATLPKPAVTGGEQPAQPSDASQPAAAAAPKVIAPVAATPDEMPTLAIDPASFRGALPGKTTRGEIEASWGPPQSAEDGVVFWVIEPFDRVEVSFDGDTVASISVKLAEPMPVADLARQLEIGDLRTVAVRDEKGLEIGEVYPERGVILSLEPGSRQATAILIEPLDADAFLLRAEGELDSCSAHALADLQHAVQIDPGHVRAHRLLLSMATDQGRWTQALSLAESASGLEPDSVWVKLKLAAVLIALDRPVEARPVLEAALAGPEVPPLLAAQAYRLLGRLCLAGKSPDHRAAVGHFTESIRRAAPLLARRGSAIQAPAREILLDAHLGTALAIATGSWQQKSRVIPKWIARSEAVVDEFDGGEFERQVLELQLCRGALEVAAGSTESIQPLPWVKRMLELRDAMSETVADPWRRRQIDWQVGEGLRAALAAAEIRGEAADMLDNATLTAAYLERGAEQRELTAGERKDLGDLMFRIGILHSLQRGDHATAVTWFDRVLPLWDENERFARDDQVGRLGESYVSMAISYWQVERRDDALELSSRGVDLMVAAVDAGQLEERALAVAYGNLATMHAEQGDDEQSRTYAEMASRAETSAGPIR